MTTFDYQQWRKSSAVTPEMLNACLDRIAELEVKVRGCRMARDNWRVKFERTEELRAMYLAEKKQAEAELAALRGVDDDNVKQLMTIKGKWQQAEAEVERLRKLEQIWLADGYVELADKMDEAWAEVAALKGRRCETCRYATGQTRWDTDVTFEKDGHAICSKIVFSESTFWDFDVKMEAAAWVVDGSDYWACLYVTPGFCCSEWAERGTG